MKKRGVLGEKKRSVAVHLEIYEAKAKALYGSFHVASDSIPRFPASPLLYQARLR